MLPQTAAAAGLAWWFAHDVLGHAQPFFAPIAASLSLSTSHVQRARRSVQMLVGVLLGIGIAEVLHPMLGSSALSITLVVAVTLFIAVALGGGFVGEGMMFVNQAAASAIPVLALHRAGTGSERAVDALVGGGVALVIGVGLFPAHPLKLLWQAEDGVLSSVLALLSRQSLAQGRMPAGAPDWPLAASHEIHRRLTVLTAARSTARASVRVAPRRMFLRRDVDAEERRVAHIYLLAGSALILARALAEAAPAGEAARGEVASLAEAVRWLRAAERPWSALALSDPRRRACEVLAAVPPDMPADPERAAVSSAARRVARDLLAVLP